MARERKPSSGKPAAASNEAAAPNSARAVAADVLTRVIHKRQSMDQAFDMLAGALEPRDRAFARELMLTSIRRAGSLRAVLNQLVAKTPPAGFVQGVLLTALAQILILKVKDHASVSESVDLMKSRRAGKPYAGLTNAVLRRVIRERDTWEQALNAEPEHIQKAQPCFPGSQRKQPWR